MASRETKKKKKEVAPPSQETVEKKKMASSEETADDIGNQESQVDDGANKEGAKVVSSERKSSENPESAETQVTAGMGFQETDQKKASVKGKGKIDDQDSAGDNKVDEEVVSSERKSEEAEEQKKKMASKSEETTTAVADDEKTRELINMLGVKLEIKDDGDDHDDDDDGEKTALIKEKAVPSEIKSPENQESAVTTETGSDQGTEKQKKIDGEKKASAKGKGKIDDQESAGNNKEASSERKSSPSPPPPKEQQESVLLFETKLKAADVHPNIQRLVFGDCADMLKWTYFKLVKEEINYYLKIMTEDPNGAEYELHFMPYFTTRYTFYNEWHKIVAANGLQEGDTVAGWGKIVAGKFKMTLTITKEGEVEKKTETQTLKEEESEKVVSSERKSSSAVPPTPPMFLFEKVMETFAVSAKRVMVSRCSQLVERAMEREEERNPKKAYRYVRVMAKDPRGAEHELHLTRDAVTGSYHLGHQWRKLVDDNRLKVGDRVEGWGNEFGDGLKVSLHIFRIKD